MTSPHRDSQSNIFLIRIQELLPGLTGAFRAACHCVCSKLFKPVPSPSPPAPVLHPREDNDSLPRLRLPSPPAPPSHAPTRTWPGLRREKHVRLRRCGPVYTEGGKKKPVRQLTPPHEYANVISRAAPNAQTLGALFL